jgi:predicted transposase YbfD/YdcC
MPALTLTQPPNTAPLSLAQHLALVPDTRHDQGKRHPLVAVLNLVAAAVLCGMRSLQAIAQFGRALTPHEAASLGFTHPITPCKSTLSEVLRHVDADGLEQQLRAWAQAQTNGDEHLALDGKTLRGTADDDVPAVHLLALYAVASGVTLAQAPVGDKTNEHKAALELLRQVPLAGKVVTADAMFTHRDFCTLIGDGGGDYVLPAKDNQPNLLRDIQAIFTPEAGLSPPSASVARRRSTTGLGFDQGTRPHRAANGADDDALK